MSPGADTSEAHMLPIFVFALVTPKATINDDMLDGYDNHVV